MIRMVPEASLKPLTFTSSFPELYINPHLLEITTLTSCSLKLHELREKKSKQSLFRDEGTEALRDVVTPAQCSALQRGLLPESVHLSAPGTFQKW